MPPAKKRARESASLEWLVPESQVEVVMEEPGLVGSRYPARVLQVKHSSSRLGRRRSSSPPSMKVCREPLLPHLAAPRVIVRVARLSQTRRVGRSSQGLKEWVGDRRSSRVAQG